MKTLSVFFLGLLCFNVSNVYAQEVRKFQVYVDGKPAGTHEMKIEEKESVLECTHSSRISVKHILGTYKYSLDAKETWKQGTLVSMTASANDDGKRKGSTIEQNEDSSYTIQSGNKKRNVTGPLWPTTFWQLPASIAKNSEITLIDPDTGKALSTKIEKSNVENIKMLGKSSKATLYKLSGEMKALLWYDADGRLVRQSWTEDGHPTILELIEYSKK